MAAGRLQTLIISTLQEHLWLNHKHEGRKCLSNKVGIHVSTGINLSCDLVAFDKTALAATADDIHYYTIPPKFVIEVDTNGDFSNKIFEDYLFKKSQRLLTFDGFKNRNCWLARWHFCNPRLGTPHRNF